MSERELHKFTVDNNSYVITSASEDYKDWTVIKQESFKLDKRQLILKKFKNDFPQFKVDDYEILTRVCSRSSRMSIWLIEAGLTYSEAAQLPLFLNEIIEPTEFVRIQQDLIEINREVSKFSDKKKLAAENYKKEIREIENNETELLKKMKSKNKFLFILSMNSTSLPFTLQLNIENYVPKDIENIQESRQMYGRELLIKYKRMLCKALIENKNLDIEDLINQNILK